MKIVCQQDDLAAGLQIAARACRSAPPSRSSRESCCAPRPRARWSWPPPTWSSRCECRCRPRCEEPGSVVLPGRLLLDIVKALPAQEVTIEQTLGTGAVRIACGSSEYSLHAQGAEDFPHLPEPDPARVQRRARGVRRDRHHVSRAASRDESRPVLTGVLVEFSDGAVTMAATDSYRLSVKQSPLPGSNVESQAIVPARALGELTRIAAPATTIEIWIGENQILFGADGVLSVGSPHRRPVPQLAPAPAADVRARDLGQPSRVPRRCPAHLADGPAEPAAAAGLRPGRAHDQRADAGRRRGPRVAAGDFQGERLEIGFNAEFLRDGVESVEGDSVS